MSVGGIWPYVGVLCMCVCSSTSLGTEDVFFLPEGGLSPLFSYACVSVLFENLQIHLQNKVSYVSGKNYHLIVFSSYTSSSVSTGIPPKVERDSFLPLLCGLFVIILEKMWSTVHEYDRRVIGRGRGEGWC